MSPSQKERLDSIEPRLNEIEARLGLGRKSPFAAFRQHIWAWLKENKAWVLSLGAIALTVSGWFIAPVIKRHSDSNDERFQMSVDRRVNQILNQSGGVNENLRAVQQTTTETNNTLKTLAPFIHDVISHQFDLLAELPKHALLERLPAIDDLVAVARRESVAADPAQTSRVGLRLLDVSEGNSAAWKSTLRFAGYRSFLNLGSASLPNISSPRRAATNYVYKNGGSHPLFAAVGSAPISEAVRFSPIGKDPNTNQESGDAVLIGTGGSVEIDGMEMRHVVFRNTEIIYNGGPIRMSDVYFVDCTFKIKQQRTGVGFVTALLQEGTATSYAA